MTAHRILVLAALSLAPFALAQDSERPVLDITARGHTLELSASEIPSGWTTLRLRNVSDAVHFAVLERMPEGRTMEDSVRDVVPVFQEAMDLIRDGDPEAGFAALGNLPEWYGGVVFAGGTGMVAPGAEADVITRLEPGHYVLECYVKDADGVFHTTRGMINEFTVTEEATDATPPAADVTVTLANPDPDDGTAPESGFTIDGAFRAGAQVVAVTFTAEAPPLLGNDLHLVRLEGAEDVVDVAAWMDWSVPGSLAEPAPATFLGGTQEQPRGTTAYLPIELQPGAYAWVSERPAAQPMYLPFDVE